MSRFLLLAYGLFAYFLGGAFAHKTISNILRSLNKLKNSYFKIVALISFSIGVIFLFIRLCRPYYLLPSSNFVALNDLLSNWPEVILFSIGVFFIEEKGNQISKNRERLRLKLEFTSSDNSTSRKAVYELKKRRWLGDGVLNGSYLDGVDLSNCMLHDLRMEYAYSPKYNSNSFENSYLINANLRGSCLGKTSFKGANLRGADLAGVRGLSGESFDRKTIMPDGDNFSEKTKIKRFTNIQYSQFWRSDKQDSPAHLSIEDIKRMGGIKTAMGAYF